jgi:hypothetical protein
VLGGREDARGEPALDDRDSLLVCMSVSTALPPLVTIHASLKTLSGKFNGNCSHIGIRNDVCGITFEINLRLDGQPVELNPAHRDNRPPELCRQQFYAGHGLSILSSRSGEVNALTKPLPRASPVHVHKSDSVTQLAITLDAAERRSAVPGNPKGKTAPTRMA